MEKTAGNVIRQRGKKLRRPGTLSGRALLVALSLFLVVAWAAVFPSHFPVLVHMVPVLGLVLLKEKFRVGILSPVVIVVLIFSAVGLLGYLLASPLEGMKGGGIRLVLDEATRVRTSYLFAATSLMILAGASVVLCANKTELNIRLYAVSVSGRYTLWILFGCMLPVVMVVASIGGDILQRDRYLAGVGGTNFFGLGQQLAIAGVAVCGNIAANGKRPHRLAALALTIVYASLFFGLGSRRLALVPLVFALGYLLGRPRKPIRFLAPSVILAGALLPLPLYMRGQSSHGIFPYLSKLGAYDLSSVNWLETVNNVLISFPITGASAFAVPAIPVRNLGISLNPLPGTFAGWYDISGSMNLNRWTPFSAIGEAGNYGLPWMVFLWVGVGVVLALLEIRMAIFMRIRYPVFAIAILGLVSLFALQALQYSIRPSTRMLVYAVAISLVASAWTMSKQQHATLQVLGPLASGKMRKVKRPQFIRS